MQLQNMEISKFKGIDHLAFNPDKINIAIGENGKGKTSLMEAVRYILTGKCPDDAISIGSTECKVSADVEGYPIIIGRKLGKTGETGIFKLSGKTTNLKSYRTMCEANGMAKKIDAAAFATSNELMNMDVDSLTEFMLANTPVNIDLNRLISLCPGISPALENELRMLLPDNGITLEMLDETDRFATEQRKSIKLMCENLKAQAVYTAEIPSEEDTEEVLQAKYEKNLQIIASKKANDENYRNYLKLVETKKRIELSVKEKEQQAETIKCARPDDSKIGQFKEEIKKKQESVNNYKGILITIRKDTELFEKTLENLKSDVCPINSKLKCTTDKSTIKEELTEAIQNNAAQIKNVETSIEKTEKDILNLQTELSKLEEDVRKYERYINLLNMIDSIRKTIPSITVTISEDKTDISQVELDNRIIKEKLENLRKYKEYKQVEDKYLKLCKKKDLYEDLCKLLDEKSGIREKILDIALSPFEEYINKRGKELQIGFEVHIRVNKGVRITYNPKGGADYLSYNSASNGEKMLIAFLILDMINALTGMNVLILDNLDKLSEDALEKLVTVLNNPDVQDSYDHIFMAAVDHNDSVTTLKKLNNAKLIQF